MPVMCPSYFQLPGNRKYSHTVPGAPSWKQLQADLIYSKALTVCILKTPKCASQAPLTLDWGLCKLIQAYVISYWLASGRGSNGISTCVQKLFSGSPLPCLRKWGLRSIQCSGSTPVECSLLSLAVSANAPRLYLKMYSLSDFFPPPLDHYGLFHGEDSLVFSQPSPLLMFTPEGCC